ncbi:hypothetical protein [Streptosporangium sp. NPDC002524]|uniref:hypothetical protein n=1 Tax=Streptosporangium sp. NPDC002524 TaxID=3154537 RepID=UPI003323B257
MPAAAVTEAQSAPVATEPVSTVPAEVAPDVDQGAAPTDPPVSASSPLTPPARPEPPVPDPGPAPEIRSLPTPGSVIVDLRWPGGIPADPEQLFDDPGPHMTTVTVSQTIIRLQYLPGATTPDEQLLYPAGWPLERAHAAKLRADLEEVRAQAAD